MPGEVVAWTGSFMSRRELLGIKLRWSYAPAEVKVLTSADGGNFEEARLVGDGPAGPSQALKKRLCSQRLFR